MSSEDLTDLRGNGGGCNRASVETRGGDMMAGEASFGQRHQIEERRMGTVDCSYQGLQVLVTYLEGKGVEVSQLKKSIEKGDSASVEAWFETSYRRHMAKILGIARQQPALRTRICLPDGMDRDLQDGDAGEKIRLPAFGRKSHPQDTGDKI